MEAIRKRFKMNHYTVSTFDFENYTGTIKVFTEYDLNLNTFVYYINTYHNIFNSRTEYRYINN